MMRNLLVRGCLAIVALIGSGCATTAKQSSFLSDTSRLHRVDFFRTTGPPLK